MSGCNDFTEVYEEDISDLFSFSSKKEKLYIEDISKYNIRQQQFIKIISGLSTHTQIKNRLMRKLFLDGMDEAIYNYSVSEKLPYEFQRFAKQNDGLEIIIKNCLKSHIMIKFDSDFIDRLKDLKFFITNRLNEDIIYDKVSYVQQFIHEEINFSSSILQLDKNIMKNTLSATRLYLEIKTLKNLDYTYMLKSHYKTEDTASSQEKIYFKHRLNKFQKYVPGWRKKHLKSLLDFFSNNSKNEILIFDKLSINENIEEYKNNIITMAKTFKS